jgi:hypothetical protein
MNDLRIIVLSCDSHYWLLRGFFHQWEKYGGGLPVTVFGYTPPPAELLHGNEFQSIGNFSDFPAGRFSDGMRTVLGMIPEKYVCIFLEDFWLVRMVNWASVFMAFDWMKRRKNAIRMDLTTDRLNSGALNDCGCWYDIDIIEATRNPYSFSFQTGIWHRERMLEMIVDGESAQTMELEGTNRIRVSNYGVYGTRQYPVRYQLMYQEGLFAWHHPAFAQRCILTDEDVASLKGIGADKKR